MSEHSSPDALFFDDADTLAGSAAAYLAGGAPDGIALVLARPERLPALEHALAARGVDLTAARQSERLVTLDAEATLSAILVDGMPDRAAFNDQLGGLVDRLARRGALRVYGEMTELLQDSGHCDALARLEELWRELKARHGFALLLSYGPRGGCPPRATVPAPRATPTEPTDLAEQLVALERRARTAEDERDRLARALDDAHAARRAAEDLVRARDEVSAVVTHDLSNPLGTIVMGATALLQLGGAGDPRAQRARAVAERIHRQAERMTRQVRDLADFAALQTGALPIERTPCAPSEIIASVREIVAPIASERGLGFEAHAPELPVVECDAERVVQALASLLGHAVKVTARGGVLEVGAHAGAHGPVFYVRHGGPGLDTDELPALFGPGWRSRNPSYRGAALGYTIARGVVEAHGGAIWADSAPDAGCTISFTLGPPHN